MGPDGTKGNLGDKHFKCYHRTRKVLTITQKMKYSLNGMDFGLDSFISTITSPFERFNKSFEDSLTAYVPFFLLSQGPWHSSSSNG